MVVVVVVDVVVVVMEAVWRLRCCERLNQLHSATIAIPATSLLPQRAINERNLGRRKDAKKALGDRHVPGGVVLDGETQGLCWKPLASCVGLVPDVRAVSSEWKSLSLGDLDFSAWSGKEKSTASGLATGDVIDQERIRRSVVSIDNPEQ